MKIGATDGPRLCWTPPRRDYYHPEKLAYLARVSVGKV